MGITSQSSKDALTLGSERVNLQDKLILRNLQCTCHLRQRAWQRSLAEDECVRPKSADTADYCVPFSGLHFADVGVLEITKKKNNPVKRSPGVPQFLSCGQVRDLKLPNSGHIYKMSYKV